MKRKNITATVLAGHHCAPDPALNSTSAYTPFSLLLNPLIRHRPTPAAPPPDPPPAHSCLLPSLTLTEPRWELPEDQRLLLLLYVQLSQSQNDFLIFLSSFSIYLNYLNFQLISIVWYHNWTRTLFIQPSKAFLRLKLLYQDSTHDIRINMAWALGVSSGSALGKSFLSSQYGYSIYTTEGIREGSND